MILPVKGHLTNFSIFQTNKCARHQQSYSTSLKVIVINGTKFQKFQWSNGIIRCYGNERGRKRGSKWRRIGIDRRERVKDRG